MAMSDQSHEIIGKNFLLKKVGNELYLPSTKPIFCQFPSFLSKEPYVLCRTARFDPASGLLSLNAPTDYGKYDESRYQLSVQMNSKLILTSGVKAFEILWGSPNVSDFPSKYEWKNLENADFWSPLSQKIEPAVEHTEGAKHNHQPSLPFSIEEKCWIAIESLIFENGKVSFTRFINTRVGEITFEIAHPGSRKEFDAIKEYF